MPLVQPDVKLVDEVRQRDRSRILLAVLKHADWPRELGMCMSHRSGLEGWGALDDRHVPVRCDGPIEIRWPQPYRLSTVILVTVSPALVGRPPMRDGECRSSPAEVG